MNIKKLNENIEAILEEGKDYQHARELGYSDAQDFKVGDRVLVLINGRVGTIKSNPAVDVYEVELDKTVNFMPRVDRYYGDDMELFQDDIQESINEDEHIRTYSVTVEVEVPANMNNIETEEAIETAIEQKYADVIRVVYIDSHAIL